MADRRLLALLALPGLAACSFLLDFDALQQGSGGAAGLGTAAAAGNGAGAGLGGSGSPAGGSSGAGEGGDGGLAGTPTGGSATGGSATGGSAGSAGSPACPDECFHDDPCLLDGCDDDGACVTGEVLGLAHDGVDATIPAEVHYRTTMIGADDAFFLSSFTLADNQREVTFYRLDGTAAELTTLGTLGALDIAGDPVSAAGLAVQPLSGAVHAFVALNDRVEPGARVWHTLLNVEDPPRPVPVSSLLDGYFASNPFNYPAAVQSGNETYVAWINLDQSIGISDTQIGTVPKRVSTNTSATTLSLLTASDGQPYVLYTVAGGGVFVERPDLPALEVTECQPAAGEYLSSSATFTNISGFWLTGWTKVAEETPSASGYLTTTGRALYCDTAGCAADMTECDDNSGSNLVRNPVTVIVHRPGDPAGRMEVVQVLPVITVEGDEATSWLMLSQKTLNFDPQRPLENGATVEDIAPPLALAEQPASAANGFRGPDFPAIAFVPPDRFAVAWTQPAPNVGDELRVQRYKMCLPD
jgi:hypothetical protein